MRTYIYVYIYIIYIYIHTCLGVFHTHIHTHTYIHTYLDIFHTHTHRHTHIFMRVHAYAGSSQHEDWSTEWWAAGRVKTKYRERERGISMIPKIMHREGERDKCMIPKTNLWDLKEYFQTCASKYNQSICKFEGIWQVNWYKKWLKPLKCSHLFY
jgi:hypothetical protein